MQCYCVRGSIRVHSLLFAWVVGFVNMGVAQYEYSYPADPVQQHGHTGHAISLTC